MALMTFRGQSPRGRRLRPARLLSPSVTGRPALGVDEPMASSLGDHLLWSSLVASWSSFVWGTFPVPIKRQALYSPEWKRNVAHPVWRESPGKTAK